VTNPRMLLADEPTGDLDAGTADRVFSLIQRMHASHGLTSILVTHNQELAGRCDRVMRLEAGHMEEDAAKTGKPTLKALGELPETRIADNGGC
jgi:lipoprotein-releasing system ATP-binding protein